MSGGPGDEPAGGAGPADLGALEDLVEVALRTGDESALQVLGYGEMTLVLGWPAGAPSVAAKRLPVFPDAASADAYLASIDGYIALLRDRGVDVLPTGLHALPRPDGTAVGYVVQPVVAAATLGPQVLAAGDPAAGHPILEGIVAATTAVLEPRLGLDAQLSNWVWEEPARLRYLDVTTPIQWDPDGRLCLDLDALGRAYPALLRPPLKRFVAPAVLRRFTDPRATLLDLCGNLLKEGLYSWLPAALRAVNAAVDPPIGEAEVRRAYASDARLWEAMLRLRRVDRTWQHRVRRRPYPFLLPGEIVR